MASDAVVVFASLRARPESVADVQRLLAWMVERTRAEPGCERYDLYRGRDGGDVPTFHLFERYRDADALAAHRTADHYVEYRRRVPPMLADEIGVVVLDPVDVAP